jgi:hypothetical protein
VEEFMNIAPRIHRQQEEIMILLFIVIVEAFVVNKMLSNELKLI